MTNEIMTNLTGNKIVKMRKTYLIVNFEKD